MTSPSVMKILLAVVLGMLSAGGHCNERLDKLIQLAGGKEAYERFVEGIFDPETMVAALPESDSPLYPLALEQKQQTEILVRKYLSWEAVRPGMIRAYSATYTVEEQDYMLELLQDELGRSILSKGNLLEQQMSAQLLPLLRQFYDEFSELNDRYQQKRESLIEELESN